MELTNIELEEIDYGNTKHLNYLKKLMKSKDMDHLWDLANKELYNNKSSNGYIVKKLDGEPIGYLNLSNPVEAYYGITISLYYAIEETKRGNGYGKSLIENINKWELSEGNVDCIIAQVKKDNIHSQNTLVRAGIEQIMEDDDFITYMEKKENTSRRR